MVCTAHANNARVIYVIHPTLEDLNTSESRSQAINAAVDHVQTWFMDGVNVGCISSIFNICTHPTSCLCFGVAVFLILPP